MLPPPAPTVLITNPTADVYGSDLQMKESVAGLRERGWRVVVAVPEEGPLVPALLDLGAEVQPLGFPVLRRASASPAGLARLAVASGRALPAMRRLIRRERPAVVYVNTVTLPWWLGATRGTGVPALCHVHEAEAADPPAVRRALAAPLFLADRVVANSTTTEETLLLSAPRLRARIRVVPNGVPGPGARYEGVPRPRRPERPRRVAVVGRLSARKAPDVALEAVAILRARGHDVELDLCGTAGPGQDDYVAGLRARAAADDLRGAVHFRGYTAPVWAALEEVDVLLAPSLGESFGNAVVEAQLAGRPVVATAVQGHCETVAHGSTGLLVPPSDPHALAAAVGRLLGDPGLARRLAEAGRRSAETRFGSARYRADIAALVGELAGVTPDQARPVSAPR